MITDEDILNIIARNKEDIEAACQKLISTANQNGGEDNVTSILVKFHA